MNEQSVLKINNINHYFGKKELQKQILSDIDLDVKKGEIIILMGQSGSGKTTLLTLIGGLRSIQKGSIQILGQELYRASYQKLVQIRRQIGYVFQAHNLLEFLTAVENVEMSAKLQPDLDKEEIRSRSFKMLQAVGLEHRANYYPDALSGGQKQRVAIARALVGSPQLILADEPTAALDSQSGRNVVELLQKLAQKQHSAILIVTHDNRILDIADKIIHMEDGRIVYS